MQEELHQFEKLDVCVLVPAPDNIKLLTLKWLFKNKHDEENTVIRNKTRLVMRGYRQKEGIDFKESFTLVVCLKKDRVRVNQKVSSMLNIQPSLTAMVKDGTIWYQAKPTKKHLKEVKRIFCYLWGTFNMGLWYTMDYGFELTGFSDADYAGCKDTFKSTSGGTQFLGGKLESWSSKKQDCMALSTAEAEYVSLSACCAQVHDWMRTS
ncbi:copia protein [Tanacetum coccineum]